jgi:hypothetical protein
MRHCGVKVCIWMVLELYFAGFDPREREGSSIHHENGAERAKMGDPDRTA